LKKILVVDDNTNTTDLVQTLLESSGYSCDRAHSGKECLNMAGQNGYDLIILDIAMPEMTGIDVVNKMKEGGLLAKNKVVFFTASSKTADEIFDLQQEGVLDCMRKPFTKAELLAIVQKHA
jgi:CheY-like chemotaxis protein